MESEIDPLEVNGDPPDIDGRTLDSLLVAEFWGLDTGLIDPAMLVWLLVEGRWHKLYFDYGMVFWRAPELERPTAYAMPEVHSEVRLLDVGSEFGLVGEVIAGYSMCAIPGGSRVGFDFLSGKSIAFSNVMDVTTYR